MAMVGLISCSTKRPRAVLLNRRDGSFGAATRYTFAEEVRSIVIGDLNGDSAADVVFGGYGLGELGVFFNRGDGTFAPADHWRLTNNPWTVALGDLNGDGTSTSPPRSAAFRTPTASTCSCL